jgi:muramoyltetrapeptide carboxypeptidase LdcA involved in peptidoglycan recycling
MLNFQTLPKLKKGDKVAILSPSFAAPGQWPHIHELGLKRVREDLGLEPVEFPTTRQLGASAEDRARDLIAAFSDPEIRGVITSIGGDDQVTYVKNLPGDVFRNNPKPFFGYSDNTHFANHLWLNGVPSFYGGCLFVQIAKTPVAEPFTFDYLRKALFEEGEVALTASETYNDIGVGWDNPQDMTRARLYEPNEGWYWDGEAPGSGITWGGCVESIDEILRHGVPLPSLEQFEEAVFIAETSEEMPTSDYVYRVFRALGERGILGRVHGLLVGRPQSWDFQRRLGTKEKEAYREEQRKAILKEFRKYNPAAPVVQNLDFGHSNPQICLPYGRRIKVEPQSREIKVEF